MSRISNAKAIDAIRERRPFDNNSSTLGGRSTFAGWGDMPADQRPNLDERFIDYWVYSYDTPIAWVWREGVAEMPNVHLSSTTAEHQRIAAAALGVKWPVPA